MTTLETSLEQWEAEERAIRAKLAAPGTIPLNELASQSGLEVFQAMFEGELP